MQTNNNGVAVRHDMSTDTNATIGEPHPARTRAEAFLREHVTGPCHAGRIIALAEAEGIRRTTLTLARWALGITSWKEYGRRHGRRFWEPTAAT